MYLTLRAVAAALASAAIIAAAQTPAPGLEGTWRATLGGKLRLVLQIEKSPDGLYTGMIDSVDQGSRIPIAAISVDGDAVKLDVKAVGGTFEGRLNAARTELAGTWNQGTPQPLVFRRDTAVPATGVPAATTGADKPVTAAEFPLGLPLDLHVPVPPTPFLGSDGKTYLVHELHVTNMGRRDFLISRLEVQAGEITIRTHEAADLESLLSAGASGAQDRRIVAAGRRAVVFLWIDVNPAALPRTLRHRVTVGDLNVTSAPITVGTEKPITIAPPLRGGTWRAVNGPARDTGHRRALIAVEGGARIAQRFAIDWVRVGADNRTFTGDAKNNKSYLAYGEEALAVADGIVAATKDGIPENIPGLTSRAVPITLETVGGNYVVLDLGGGRYAFYAHLQPGSLRVKSGDRVKVGQVLGLVGNSGNSTEPHLHFHISDGLSPLASEGLPYAIAGRTGMPLGNDRVDFGR